MKKNSAKAPSFQFYPKDWLSENRLKRASFVAKGVWIDLICLSYDMPEPGVFCDETGSLSESEILKMLNGKEQQKTRGFQELKERNIIKQLEDGTFYVKRIQADMKLRAIRKEAGSKGGNPNLVGNLVNQKVNQKSTPSSSTSFSSASSTAIHDNDSPKHKNNTDTAKGAKELAGVVPTPAGPAAPFVVSAPSLSGCRASDDLSAVGLSVLSPCREWGGRTGGGRKFMEGLDPATADPKLLLEDLAGDLPAEQREFILFERVKEWLAELFPAELGAHNRQGRADQTWLFGKAGRAGLVQQTLDHRGESGLIELVELGQKIYFKVRDEENPLRNPLAVLCKKLREWLAGYHPAAEQLPPDPLAELSPAAARQKGHMLFIDGLARIFEQEQGLTLKPGDYTTFSGIFAEHWQQAGQAGIWRRIAELLNLARASRGKRKPPAYFTAEAKRILKEGAANVAAGS